MSIRHFALCAPLFACGGMAVTKTSSVAPAQPGAHVVVDVVPKSAPGFVSGYDFELLDPVQGTACFSDTDTNTYSAVVPGVDLTVAGNYLATNALQAAAIDAIGKLANADTIFILRMKTAYENATKVCATVDGRGVRLIKTAGAQPAPQPPPAPPAPPPAATAPTPPAK